MAEMRTRPILAGERRSPDPSADCGPAGRADHPAVKETEELGVEGEELVEVAVQVKVERLVDRLKEAPVIGAAVGRRELKVAGGVYDLETGEVDWL